MFCRITALNLLDSDCFVPECHFFQYSLFDDFLFVAMHLLPALYFQKRQWRLMFIEIHKHNKVAHKVKHFIFGLS